MIPEFEELEELRLPYLRADGAYDAGILVIASRYAQMAAIRRDDVERLTAEVKWLQDYGRIPQLEALLLEARQDLVRQHDGERYESLEQILEWQARVDAAMGKLQHKSLAHQPSYVPPPADPLLAKPEKNR